MILFLLGYCNFNRSIKKQVCNISDLNSNAKFKILIFVIRSLTKLFIRVRVTGSLLDTMSSK